MRAPVLERSAAIAELAEYLTGDLVPMYNMILLRGGPSAELAERFFAIRKTMNISGQMDRDEARIMIFRRIERP